MGTIVVQGIKTFSYHGCLDEEGKVGTHYSIDVHVNTDFSKAIVSDELEDTVDYSALSLIVQEEMAIRSKLIEHVGQRIINRMLQEIAGINDLSLHITKISAPIQGEVDSVKVIMHG
ncbi:MAG: dihydroneopterin aldolase [Flavobacteriales bacterium]|jgi:dihydroneopterin aldolase